MIKASGIQGKYLEYKGLPLVRQGNEIYYGDMSDKYYLFLLIMEQKKDEALNIDVPSKVMVQVCATADNKVEKNTIRESLYDAFDLGVAWLERLNR